MSRLSHGWILLALVGAAVLESAAVIAEPVGAVKQPETKVGPYRVVIDRVAESRNTQIVYGTPSSPKAVGGVQSRRTVQLQLGVMTESKSAAAGLASLQVQGLSVQNGARTAALSYYGGILESPNDVAVLRAYLYIPNYPVNGAEIRTLEGQITAWDQSDEMEIEVPLEGPSPWSAEKGGVKATVSALTVEGGSARLSVNLEAPKTNALLSPTNDGTYGVSLLNRENRPAMATGGNSLQQQENTASYRLGFQNLKGEAAKVRVRLVHRRGPRRTYPFRIEHITIPTRPLAPPEQGGGQEK